MHGCQYTHAQPYIHTNTYIHIHICTHTHPIHTHPYTHASVKPQTMKCASMPIHVVPGVRENLCENLCENFGFGMLSKVSFPTFLALVKIMWKLCETNVGRFARQSHQFWTTFRRQFLHEVFTKFSRKFSRKFSHTPFHAFWAAAISRSVGGHFCVVAQGLAHSLLIQVTFFSSV